MLQICIFLVISSKTLTYGCPFNQFFGCHCFHSITGVSPSLAAVIIWGSSQRTVLCPMVLMQRFVFHFVGPCCCANFNLVIIVVMHMNCTFTVDCRRVSFGPLFFSFTCPVTRGMNLLILALVIAASWMSWTLGESPTRKSFLTCHSLGFVAWAQLFERIFQL